MKDFIKALKNHAKVRGLAKTDAYCVLGVRVRHTGSEEAKREETKLKARLSDNRTTHRLEYSAIMGMWHCVQCWKRDSTVWNVNREHAGYNKDFVKLATTACEWHADREGIT